MKKILEITEDVEKHLVAIMHTALKTAGMEVLGSIDYVRNSIKTQECAVCVPEVQVVSE